MLTRSEHQCEVLRVQQDALRASLPPESEKAGYERRIDELESKLALSMQQAAHMAGKHQTQTEQLRQVEGQYAQCQQRLTPTTEEMSARITFSAPRTRSHGQRSFGGQCAIRADGG